MGRRTKCCILQGLWESVCRRTGSPARLLRLAFVLVWAGAGWAQTWVEGVEDREVYKDRVSFVVPSEEGLETTASLNGWPVATDVSVTIDKADYYELHVRRAEAASGAEHSEVVRFIVRDSSRGNAEWGLPPWTPYPMVDSATGEFAGAQLKLVAPAQYPAGLEIPVIARVENEAGRRVGVNGEIKAAEFPDRPLDLLRGVGSVFLPGATDPGPLLYKGWIHSLAASCQIAIEAVTDWQTVSGEIVAETNWPQNARIRVAGDALTIKPGATLTVGAGSVLLVDPDTDIVVEGEITVNGTVEHPVVFTCEDRRVPWGGFLFEAGGSIGTFTGTILTGSGADPDWLDNHSAYGHSHRHEQCLFFLADDARLTLTDCFLVENQGQAGHGEDAYLTMTRCLVQKCITAGQYNGGSVVLNDCALIEFPSADAPFADDDNDGLYLTGGAHVLTDCLIGWALDDGVDAGSGSGGSVMVERCWFESCYHEAMAWSEARDADVADAVALNCGQGIECGFGSPDVDAVRCLSTANLVGARFGDNYDWSYHGFLRVRDSLLLFNQRDVWGQAWDDWSVHFSQMDVRNNHLSLADPYFPDNAPWDPKTDPNQLARLAPFLPTNAGIVGVGLAVDANLLDVSELGETVAVRLSAFTTSNVSVDYTVEADGSILDSDTLHFVPGETVKQIPLGITSIEGRRRIRVTLRNPVNAELTGNSEITYLNAAAFIKPLVVSGDSWRYFKGTQEPPADWNTLSFDDNAWPSGPTPIGYETGSGYESCIATDLPDMRNGYLSVYARRQFHVEDPSQLSRLTLAVDFDDGYIAFINGVRVAGFAEPDEPAHDQPALHSHEACGGDCDPEPVDLTDYLHVLVPGANVLAIQVHNQSLSSSDLLLDAELSAAPVAGTR